MMRYVACRGASPIYKAKIGGSFHYWLGGERERETYINFAIGALLILID